MDADRTDSGIPDLPGYTTGVTRSGDGRVALLTSACDPQFPWWFRLLVWHDGGWEARLPPELRLAAPLAWAPDGSVLAVPAFRGIRRGVVVVEPDSGAWWWASPDDDASYVEVEPGRAGGYVDAVRVGLDGSRAPVRIERGGRTHRRLDGAGAEGAGRIDVRLVRWEVAAGTLEGTLAVPVGGEGGPWPLVVELHGGPVGAFQAGDGGYLAEWCARGFAAFRPEFRASGILGPDAMWNAFRGDGLPSKDLEVQELLGGVAALADTGLVDGERMFVLGHSYGAYLVNRIVTAEHPFRAAVCWEGVADLRLLTGASLELQTRWRGGAPDDLPDVWAAGSPVERADRATVPVLLAYGERGLAVPQGEAWFAALRRQGVPSAYVVYPDEGHVLTKHEHVNDLLDRAAAWFRSAGDGATTVRPSGPR